MNKIPDECEITIIVKCGGKIFRQGPHRNVLTGEKSEFSDLKNILQHSVAFLMSKIIRDLSYMIVTRGGTP